MSVEGRCDPRFARVRERLEKTFADGREHGAAVCVWLDGEPVVDLWGGHADAERQRPWRADTLVHTASTTKGPAAACIHWLADHGKLDLDAPVAEIWPEFAQEGKQAIPVHMLLSHRAGLPALRDPLPPEALFDQERMTAALAAERPWWEPGTRHGYHAVTFGWLVGEVVRRVDGRSLGTLLREEIAGPLGIDFHVGLRPDDEARCADIVTPAQEPAKASAATAGLRKSSLLKLTFNNPRWPREGVNSPEWRRGELPAANGHGSARGVARFYAALALGGELDGVRLLSPDALERATREQAFGPDEVLGIPMRFGQGFMLTHPGAPLGRSPHAFGHMGMGGSLGFADPDRRLGFGYVANRMLPGLTGDTRGFGLIHAVYASLEA